MHTQTPGLWGLFVCSTLFPAARHLLPVVCFKEIMRVEVLTWLASCLLCVQAFFIISMTRVKYHFLTITPSFLLYKMVSTLFETLLFSVSFSFCILLLLLFVFLCFLLVLARQSRQQYWNSPHYFFSYLSRVYNSAQNTNLIL